MLDVVGSIGFSSRVVLPDVRLHVAPGEVVCLAGVNGVGKTTLLRTAAGLLRPRSGHVEVSGAPADAPGCRPLVGYLPDTPPLYEELTAWEHLDLVARLWRRPDVADRADRLAELFEIDEVLFSRADAMSLGQRKRLALTIALAHDPTLLLLDEPFNGLDRRGNRILRDLLAQRQAEGAAVLCATHLVDHLEGLATRLVVLSDGEVVCDSVVEGRLGDLYDATLDALRQQPATGADDAPSPSPGTDARLGLSVAGR